MIIDAKGVVLGRLAGLAAEQALRGNTVHIVNSAEAVITGRAKNTIEKAKKRQEIGVVKQGPYTPKKPAGLMRRAIRGMLPWKKPRGKEAFTRVKCYEDYPEDIKGEVLAVSDKIKATKLTTLKRMTLGELCIAVSGAKGKNK